MFLYTWIGSILVYLAAQRPTLWKQIHSLHLYIRSWLQSVLLIVDTIVNIDPQKKSSNENTRQNPEVALAAR